MNAKQVKRLLGRYRDVVATSTEAIEELKDYDHGIPIRGSLVVVGRLEIKAIDEAVEWLDQIAEGKHD